MQWIWIERPPKMQSTWTIVNARYCVALNFLVSFFSFASVTAALWCYDYLTVIIKFRGKRKNCSCRTSTNFKCEIQTYNLIMFKWTEAIQKRNAIPITVRSERRSTTDRLGVNIPIFDAFSMGECGKHMLHRRCHYSDSNFHSNLTDHRNDSFWCRSAPSPSDVMFDDFFLCPLYGYIHAAHWKGYWARCGKCNSMRCPLSVYSQNPRTNTRASANCAVDDAALFPFARTGLFNCNLALGGIRIPCWPLSTRRYRRKYAQMLREHIKFA